MIDETKKLILRLIGEHVAVASRLEVPLGSVMADPGQITQVLVNLAVNARDAMPGGGRVTIETTNASVGAVEAAELGLEPGEYVVLAVADTGVGIDAATVKRVFEPFFTTKPVGEGSGLGLSTVYGIARQSGGGVSIASEPGNGTTVRVYLPRIDGAAEPADEPESHVDAARGRGTILLVEDEDVIRRLAGEMLERQGYTVLSAADPETALELAARGGDGRPAPDRRRHARHERPRARAAPRHERGRRCGCSSPPAIPPTRSPTAASSTATRTSSASRSPRPSSSPPSATCWTELPASPAPRGASALLRARCASASLSARSASGPASPGRATQRPDTVKPRPHRSDADTTGTPDPGRRWSVGRRARPVRARLATIGPPSREPAKPAHT